MSRFYLFAFLLICVPDNTACAQREFDYSQSIRQAYDDILLLKFEEAFLVLNDVRRESPENLLPDFYDYHIHFLEAFIAEEDEYFETLLQSSTTILDKLRAASESPYKRYLLADVHIQRALVRSKFQQYLRAGLDLNKANRLLEKNKKRYPDFIYSDKGLSLIHSFFGTLSGFQRGMISFFTSIEASIDQGVEEINALGYEVERHSIHKAEILFAQALIAMHIEKDAEKAWRIIQSQTLPPKSPLVLFFRASLAIQMGKHEEGIDLLSEYSFEEGSFPFYYLHYMYGVSLLNRLSPKAEGPILEFIENFKGKTYLKEACQKISWYQLVINNDEAQYRRWIKKVENIGTALVGEDVSAIVENASGLVPNITLLKARLLFDGGRYQETLSLLLKNKYLANENEHRLEYIYRLGRIHESLQDYEKAINSYNEVITTQSPDGTFYRCSAALRMGMMSEEKGEKGDSKRYYELCLNIDPPYFSKSLHQKAKFGLRRIRKM